MAQRNGWNSGEVLITTLTATTAVNIPISSSVLANFNYYALKLNNIQISSQTAAYLGLQFSTDNNSTHEHTTNDTGQLVFEPSQSGGYTDGYHQSADQIALTYGPTTDYGVSTDPISGVIEISNMGSSLKPRVTSNLKYQSTAKGLIRTYIEAQNTTAATYNSAWIICNAGVGSVGTTYAYVAGGTIEVWGSQYPFGT